MSNTLSIPITEKYPNFLKLLFFVEMWERFSYYGMRCLLVLFLTSTLKFSDQKSFIIYSLFAAVGYAGPIIGGILADKFMGFRPMIIIGGSIITLGHLVLAFTNIYPEKIFLGLALIAVGTGLFKGNITNLLGTCYTPEDPNRSQGFTLFYISVNLGSVLASVSCGYVATIFGWHYGFGLAGIGMLIGLLTFLKFQKILDKASVHQTPKVLSSKIPPYHYFLTFCGGIIAAFGISKGFLYSELFIKLIQYTSITVLITFIYIVLTVPVSQRRNLIALAILVCFFMLFFALEMQLGSFIALFTQRNVTNNILGFPIPASVSQALNPFSIIILGYLSTLIFKNSKKYDLNKFLFGLTTMALSFFVLYTGCLSASIEGKVSYIFLIISMSLIGLGEVCIAPFIQDQCTILAPKHLKGFIMGIVMLSLSFSNLAGIALGKFIQVPSIDGHVDTLQSLAIYKNGFLKICLYNLGLAGAFLPFYFYLQRILIKKDVEILS